LDFSTLQRANTNSIHRLSTNGCGRPGGNFGRSAIAPRSPPSPLIEALENSVRVCPEGLVSECSPLWLRRLHDHEASHIALTYQHRHGLRLVETVHDGLELLGARDL